MNQEITNLRAKIAKILDDGETHVIAGRYPVTYACDFLRSHANILPVNTWQKYAFTDRANALRIINIWAQRFDLDREVVLTILADAYLAEHHIKRVTDQSEQ